MQKIELGLNLPEDILDALRQVAQQRKVQVDGIISEVLQAYVDDRTDKDVESEKPA